MSGVDQEFLRTLKEKVNIVEVAGSYITLDKRGASYWACCPFHHEKTPSFAINEAGQYYHCFGCGESGDVIRFVSEMESLDFMEAVKLLADRAKMPMPETGPNDKKTAELKRKRDTLLKILNDCAHFYLNNLNSGNADAHIDYILKRQIPSPIVRTFGLGASLNFTDLPKYLLSKGYSRQDIVDSGTVNDVNGRLTDAEGGRLIFPIINSYGEVIGFGGRALKKTDFGKYVNTRETVIFNKRKNLYNINLLKKLKRTQAVKEVIMVEGYMDTLSLYQAGFKNVVASMGTSLTQDQARLIKRYVDTVLISYDGDGAGQKANLRGLDILKDEGLNVKVVPLPEGLDPDDVIKQRGAEGYQACLDAAMPLIDYKLSVLRRGYDLSKTEDKRRYVAEALGIIRAADSEAEREELLKQLRDTSGISFEALKRDLQNARQGGEVKKEPPPVRRDSADSSKKASRFVLSGFLFGADYTQGADIADVPFKDDVHILIAKYIRSKKLMEEPVRISELFEFFDEKTPEYDELNRILDNAEGGGLDGAVAEKYFSDCMTKLYLDDIDARIAEEKERLSGVDDIAARAQIAQAIYALTKQREKIKNGERK
ncbi:MAG: DNA primase [Clostridiales bacterium]|nr:DNA primase [Clostridiales bacterium]